MIFEKRTPLGYFWRQQGWVYVLLVVAGLALGAFKISEGQTASRMSAEGIDTVGQVTNKSFSLHGTPSRKTYQLSYSFPTPADPYTHGMQSVSLAFYDAQSEGAEIVVRYIPSDTTISAVEPESIVKLFWVTLAASVGLVLGGIGGGAHAMSRARTCVALRDAGEVRTATVTSHKTEGKKRNKGHMLWSDATGMDGRTQTRLLSELLPVGTAITIFADPEGRKKPVWEGDVGSR